MVDVKPCWSARTGAHMCQFRFCHMVRSNHHMLSHLKWSKQDNRNCCASIVLSRAMWLAGISPIFTEHHLTRVFNCISHFWLLEANRMCFFNVFFTLQRAIIQLLSHLQDNDNSMHTMKMLMREKNIEVCRRRCTEWAQTTDKCNILGWVCFDYRTSPHSTHGLSLNSPSVLNSKNWIMAVHQMDSEEARKWKYQRRSQMQDRKWRNR